MLIANASESHLVSNLGWVDRNSVWACETATRSERRVPLGDAAFLSLRPGTEGLFAAVHHYDGKKIAITAHPIESPQETLARVELAGAHFTFDGEKHVWRCLPRAYVANFESGGTIEYTVFVVDPERHTVEHHRPAWYDDSYDKPQQGLLGATDVPGTSYAVVSVQRSHEPVLYDAIARKLIRKVPLAGRHGNPMVQLRRRASEMWATDYDHLVKVETIDWSMVRAVRLQVAQDPQALFIGDFAFNHDESLCVVARPFSGDVLALETHGMEVKARAAIGSQPLQVVILRDQRIFARDWKTGALLTGTLKLL